MTSAAGSPWTWTWTARVSSHTASAGRTVAGQEVSEAEVVAREAQRVVALVAKLIDRLAEDRHGGGVLLGSDQDGADADQDAGPPAPVGGVALEDLCGALEDGEGGLVVAASFVGGAEIREGVRGLGMVAEGSGEEGRPRVRAARSLRRARRLASSRSLAR